jgi:hypothetical protein
VYFYRFLLHFLGRARQVISDLRADAAGETVEERGVGKVADDEDGPDGGHAKDGKHRQPVLPAARQSRKTTMASAASFLAAMENMATQEDRQPFCLATGERVAGQKSHFPAVVSHPQRYKGGSGEGPLLGEGRVHLQLNQEAREGLEDDVAVRRTNRNHVRLSKSDVPTVA